MPSPAATRMATRRQSQSDSAMATVRGIQHGEGSAEDVNRPSGCRCQNGRFCTACCMLSRDELKLLAIIFLVFVIGLGIKACRSTVTYERSPVPLPAPDAPSRPGSPSD